MAGSTMATSENDSGGCDFSKSKSRSVKKRLVRQLTQAPATWFETISTLSETLRFTYSETLGKWPIGDLAVGINYLIRRLDVLQVASVYGGENCVRLKGPEIIDQLYHYLRLLTLCMLFSEKPFQVFLESAGYSDVDVLLQNPKAGLLKPAFTILRDENSKCFLLLIRGTHSIIDTLTAATGAVVPFHHSVLHDGGISNLVLGYAHCGMVAAARWIAKLSTPSLLKALEQNPDYKVKIVGHSLGGGTAAILTYILREQKELSTSTCVTFAPAACMTWELAESGKHFITTIVNGSDLVPTFSAASVDDLLSEVTASSWLNDHRDQVERNRVMNVIYHSATALGSHLPSIANAKAMVAGAGALLRPVSSSTQVVMKRAQEISASTCVTFAPAACMTWELAESGKHFITTIVNGFDLVPTFSASSVDDLRSEVTALSWLNDLRDQVEHNRVMNVIYLSATALGSRLPSIENAKARVAGAGALLRPVSSSTQVVIKCAQEISASTCVTFAPAACMTWELAESGKHFISTIVNGSDLVPTFSAASVDDLRSEVTASSWLNDLRDQVERNSVMNVIYRSATALGSRLPSIANAKARVAGAGALLRPVSSSTQVVMKRAQDVAQAVVSTRSSISSWTSMGPRRRAVSHSSNFKADVLTEASLFTERTSEFLVSEEISSNSRGSKAEFCFSTSESGQYETDEEEDLIRVDEVAAASTIEEITEGELWYELAKELRRQEDETDIQIQEEEEAAIKETSEEKKVLADTVESQTPVFSSDVSDNHHFYPPGRIMHIVPIHLPEATGHGGPAEEQVGLYETPRELYSKLRLSKTMINDHFMSMHKKMMDLLVKQLENDLDSSCAVA